jgi:hypothetical protein
VAPAACRGTRKQVNLPYVTPMPLERRASRSIIRTGSSRRFYECSENRPCAKPPLVDSLWRRRIRAAKRTRDPRSGGTFPRAVPRDEMMLPWPLRRSKIDSHGVGRHCPDSTSRTV